ncbi:MAG: glycosyl hydrolase family 65 protein [Acidobacteriota bacterium]
MLNFHPKLIPGANTSIKFPLTYRGRKFRFEIENHSAKYSLIEGNNLTLYHYDEKITLSKSNPVVTRPLK